MSDTHGVLITFKRADALRDHLDRLAAQTQQLSTLLVVDNDNDPQIRAMVETAVDAAESVRYLGLSGNPGPAGGIAAGVAETIRNAADDSWLVLLDDDDPPEHPHTLEALSDLTIDLSKGDVTVGGVGLWGATLNRAGRLHAASGEAPEKVSYLPGGACPHYNVGVLRQAGGPDPTLFFGFDDLDLGLSVLETGASLWSSGFARDHGWRSMVENRSSSATVSAPTWRRYYSLRNLIVVLRRNGRPGAAAAMSLLAGIAKPLINLPLRPRSALRNLRLNAMALRHGWSGRTGKTIDPRDLPDWLKSG